MILSQKAQELTNVMPTLTDLKKRIDEQRQFSEPSVLARPRNKLNTGKAVLQEYHLSASLMPRQTLNYTKVKQAKDDLKRFNWDNLVKETIRVFENV